jgi:hypothetical protein
MKPILVTVVSFLFIAGCSGSRQAKTERPRLSAIAEFELRGKCAELGDKMLEEGLWEVVGPALTAEMTTNYSPEANRCYVEFTLTKNLSYNYLSTPRNYRTKTVYDGQTKRTLACTSQQGDKRSGLIWTVSSGTGYATYEQTSAEINRLMGADAKQRSFPVLSLPRVRSYLKVD